MNCAHWSVSSGAASCVNARKDLIMRCRLRRENSRRIGNAINSNAPNNVRRVVVRLILRHKVIGMAEDKAGGAVTAGMVRAVDKAARVVKADMGRVAAKARRRSRAVIVRAEMHGQ
jgi:hypothetical protein